MSFVKNNFKNIDDCHANEIRQLLMLVHHIAMSFEVKEVSDFFDGRCFMLCEVYEDLSSSYELIKLGYYKHAFAGLRFAHDCGLYSIYYSENNKDLKKYVHSKIDSPRIDKKFWEKITEKNISLKEYNKKYPLKNLYNPEELHNYIHTKGIFYSYFGFFHRLSIRNISYQDSYELWYQEFLSVIKLICVLHLLQFPLLAHVFSHEFLELKFGTLEKCPFFGGLHGDYSEIFLIAIPENEFQFIKELASKDGHSIGVINWLNSLPDLEKKEEHYSDFRDFIVSSFG